MAKRKLIEVSLPLEQINKQSAREKSIRHGHPSTLHLWWARRPLAAARAVLFSQLVDDPSSYEDEYREEAKAQGLRGDAVRKYVDRRVTAERARLHNLLSRLVDWDNLSDEGLIAEAQEEIRKSCGGNPPAILDPFAGGGSIPLEAQRLGLEAHARDLNPVAVLINKALIEIPPKFAGQAPVSPDATRKLGEWPRATGMAEDVRRYGAWMREEAERRIGYLYPKADLEDGSKANVIAWIWARTVQCPNPACAVQMPLVRSWWLGKKKGREAYAVPNIRGDRVIFTVGHDPRGAPSEGTDGTVSRNGAQCVSCQSAVPFSYLRDEARSDRMSTQLMAVVAEGKRGRQYLAPDQAQCAAAEVARPSAVPHGELFDWPGRINVVRYGLTEFADLFTNRQLVALTTLTGLVGEVREQIVRDACAAGMELGERLEKDGTGAAAYADAVATYLALTTSKMTNLSSTITSWMSDRGALRETFARQAIPMVWDFAEANVLGDVGGGLMVTLEKNAMVLEHLPLGVGGASQADAGSLSYDGVTISTDPPYYDNIGYSDLSDYFYVWLRASLRDIHPSLLSTLLVPKAEELVANPYRHHGKEGAKKFFEDGFARIFARARSAAADGYPVTVYYAFKQTESDAQGTASTGWETLLDGMVQGGWEIVATWPMRTEGTGRILARGANALASSIVLALRPRPMEALANDRRGFLAQLRQELPLKLRELQEGAIAPVDLPQAAIGPGMAVFSRYSKVVDPDGSKLSVREALRLINTVLGEVLSEQEGDFDTETRWCLKWFETNGFDKAAYGEAETLASAYNTSVSGLDHSGAVHAKAGIVKLLDTPELPAAYRPERDDHLTLWEVMMHLAKALDESGLDEAGRILLGASDRIEPELVKELSYLTFSLAEKRGMTKAAGLFNALVTSWPEVVAAAKARASGGGQIGRQAGFDFDDDLNT